MVSRSCVCALTCVLLALPTPVPAARRAGARDLDSYTLDATDLRDYIVGLEYDAPDAPAPLPEFILDYANMIRNDVILLDNSVETRTRKRGNIKVKKQTSNVPCDCQRTYSDVNDYHKNYMNLSDMLGPAEWYPQKVRNLTCDEHRCAKDYKCQKIIYELTVLKRSSSKEDRDRAGELYENMANELKFKWVPQLVPVVAGCLCTSTYLAN